MIFRKCFNLVQAKHMVVLSGPASRESGEDRYMGKKMEESKSQGSLPTIPAR